MFYRLYSWLKYTAFTPSVLFKQRLILERESRARRQLLIAGRTFINSTWTTRSTSLIQTIFIGRWSRTFTIVIAGVWLILYADVVTYTLSTFSFIWVYFWWLIDDYALFTTLLGCAPLTTISFNSYKLLVRPSRLTLGHEHGQNNFRSLYRCLQIPATMPRPTPSVFQTQPYPSRAAYELHLTDYTFLATAPTASTPVINLYYYYISRHNWLMAAASAPLAGQSALFPRLNQCWLAVRSTYFLQPSINSVNWQTSYFAMPWTGVPFIASICTGPDSYDAPFFNYAGAGTLGSMSATTFASTRHPILPLTRIWFF